MDGKRLTEIDNGAWIDVATREDLPGSTTRVLMFIRGVGERMGTVTRIFELPWKIYDPDWMGHTEQPLTAVARYINLDSIDAKYELLRADAAELAQSLKASEFGQCWCDCNIAECRKAKELLSRPSVVNLIKEKDGNNE